MKTWRNPSNLHDTPQGRMAPAAPAFKRGKHQESGSQWCLKPSEIKAAARAAGVEDDSSDNAHDEQKTAPDAGTVLRLTF